MALSLSKLNVPVSSVSSVVPFTNKLPAKFAVAFATPKSPVAAPILISVAAPNAFIVVEVSLIKLNVLAFVVISPPSIFKSKSTSNALCIVVVPVAAPIATVVASPPILIVVAVVSNRPIVTLPAIMLVVIVGLVPNTATPVPVSSLNTPASCVEVVEAN